MFNVARATTTLLLMALASCMLLLLCVGQVVNHVLLAGLHLIDDLLDELHQQPKFIQVEVEPLGIGIPPTNWR